MQNNKTSKSTGLKKIWREIKRPFKKGIWQTIVRLIARLFMSIFRPLIKQVFRAVVRAVVNDRKLAKQILSEEIAKREAGKPSLVCLPHWREHWEGYFQSVSLDELSRRKEVLKSNMDIASREAVEYLFNFRWDEFTNMDNIVLRSPDEVLFGKAIFPEFRREKDEIRKIYAQYKCPYSIPHVEACIPMGCGLKYMPEQVLNDYISGKDIIDGGGWCGDTSMMFMEYDVRNVYCFEPHPKVFESLKKVLSDNEDVLRRRKSKIIPVQCALGNGKGSGTFYSGTDTNLDFGGGLNRPAQGMKCEVEIVSIDDFVREHNLTVGMIKLDVEGSEYDVIKGALNTIKKQHPVLCISLYHTARDFFEIKPMLDDLDLGYKFMVRQFSRFDDWMEYNLLAYTQ